MIAFIRGIRTRLRTTWMSASARMVSSRVGNFSSRSRIRKACGAGFVFEVGDEVLTAWGDPGGGRVRGGAEGS
jgi:hypothetical protein